MEIAKQELIVQARETASRVLSALSGACWRGSRGRDTGCRPLPVGLLRTVLSPCRSADV